MLNSKGSSKLAQKGQKVKKKSSTASTKTATSRKNISGPGSSGSRSNTVSATNNATGVTVTDGRPNVSSNAATDERIDRLERMMEGFLHTMYQGQGPPSDEGDCAEQYGEYLLPTGEPDNLDPEAQQPQSEVQSDTARPKPGTHSLGFAARDTQGKQQLQALPSTQAARDKTQKSISGQQVHPTTINTQSHQSTSTKQNKDDQQTSAATKGKVAEFIKLLSSKSFLNFSYFMRDVNVLARLSNLTPVHAATWHDVNSKFSEDVPNVLMLVDLLLKVPSSSVECERGFSLMKRINQIGGTDLVPAHSQVLCVFNWKLLEKMGLILYLPFNTGMQMHRGSADHSSLVMTPGSPLKRKISLSLKMILSLQMNEF
ncbi:hypothetical protein HOLleu_10608 [Holothuria leucospilota]|uniref:Uncharacterized protein n=1 Tax=Holothuria leucospilota TaxID=206669 RepID=A0A9Q1HEZ8_HOLLE|nr:hypothetical protein HOLleu_10608 [Holothuria leucospilota]